MMDKNTIEQFAAEYFDEHVDLRELGQAGEGRSTVHEKVAEIVERAMNSGVEESELLHEFDGYEEETIMFVLTETINGRLPLRVDVTHHGSHHVVTEVKRDRTLAKIATE